MTEPLLILIPTLVLVGFFDLRYMRIPNALSWALLVLFGATFLFTPTSEFLMHILAGLTVFALGFTGFCFRILGGGDVKILAALVLFIPLHEFLIFANVFSVAMILGIVFVLTTRRIVSTSGQTWKFLSEGAGFPMGISIAFAGIAHPIAALLFSGSLNNIIP
ncbi:MAG: prepilin peptidase [Paracoccaceae bacterium]